MPYFRLNILGTCLGRAVAFILLCGALVSLSPNKESQSPVTVDRISRTLRYLGVLSHAAYMVAGDEEKKSLTKLGFYFERDAGTEEMYNLWQSVGQECLTRNALLSEDAKELFIEGQTNLVVLHAIVLEKVDYKGSLLNRPSFFMNKHAPQFKSHIQRLNILLQRVECTPFLGSCGISSSLAPVRQLSWETHQDVVRSISDFLGQATNKQPWAVLIDPLLPSLTGTNAHRDGHSRWIILGPAATEEEKVMLIAHEFLHEFAHELICHWRVAQVLYRRRHIFADVKNSRLGCQGYTSWLSYFEEALVRAMSYHVAKISCRDTGFTFEPELCLAFDRLHSQSLNDILDMIISVVEKKEQL